MGIEGFQPWLRATFGDRNARGRKVRYFYDLASFVSSNKSKKVRRLFIDLNALIHNAITEVYGSLDEELREEMKIDPDKLWLGETGVFETVVETLRVITMLVKPTDLLYIAADGVVTKAKMMQQRERSYAALKVPEQIFDRAQIKPGTQFMNSLSSYLKKRLAAMSNANKAAWPKKIEFSDASLPGEGEHKIMRRMSEKPSRPTREFLDSFDVVYSPDSDMTLLVMLHAAVNDQIVIMRQQHDYDHLNPDATLRWEYHDATGIKSDLNTFYGISHIPDFIVISCLAGNDFLPGLPCTMGDRMNVFDYIVRCYGDTFGPDSTGKGGTLGQANLIQGSNIIWPNVMSYLKIFTVYQMSLLKGMYIDQQKNQSRYVQIDPESGDIIKDRRWEVLEYAMAEMDNTYVDRETGWNRTISGKDLDPIAFKHQYHRFISGVWVDKSKFELENVDLFQGRDMAMAYLGGIKWVLAYYWTQERNVNVHWSYAYSYAPTVHDLIDALKFEQPASFEREPMLPYREMVTPIEHLLAILPAEKLHFVPKVVRVTFLEMMPDLYPDDFVIDYSGVRLDDDKGREIHKAKVLINTPSLIRISRLFSQFKDDPAVVGAMGMGRMWRKTVHAL